MSLGLLLSVANPGLLGFNSYSSRSGGSSHYDYDDDRRRRALRARWDEEDRARRDDPDWYDIEEGDMPPRANQYRPHKARAGRKPASTVMAVLMAERRAEAARIAALPPYEWRWSITKTERAVQTDLWHRYTVPLQEAARAAAEAEHAQAAARVRRAEEDKAAGRRLLFVVAVAGVLALAAIIAFGIRGA